MTDIVDRLRDLAAIDNCQASLEAADLIERLRAANRILRLGLNGLVDSNDVAEIADAIAAGEAIDWDRYPPTARAALEEGMTIPDEREDCTGLEDSSTANPCGREDCEEEDRT